MNNGECLKQLKLSTQKVEYVRLNPLQWWFY